MVGGVSGVSVVDRKTVEAEGCRNVEAMFFATSNSTAKLEHANPVQA